MYSIFKKELHSFFSSPIGYLVMAVFITSIGLFMWVFSSTSVLEYNFATMDQLFSIAPLVFLFLIPAVTMSSFAEENSRGTIELLYTKPLSTFEIILGKYFAAVVLVIFSLLPTVIYFFSIYELGLPKGNIDFGAVIGSYIGLFFLASAFVSIGLFSSALSGNQIIAFILAAFMCFMVHWSFFYISAMPVFRGKLDLFIQKLGINYHYTNISQGLIETKDIVYFLSVIGLFLFATTLKLDRRS
ncbi:MAG: gliding motility-associated ABC transporter permease subunit GldF [Saprospiraceae bacterium]